MTDVSVSDVMHAIILANEPVSYRQALAHACRAERPILRVIDVAPEDLDRAIREYSPLIVVCDRLTQLVESVVSAWILLYPGGTGGLVGHIDGERKDVSDPDLPAILALIDRAGALAAG